MGRLILSRPTHRIDAVHKTTAQKYKSFRKYSNDAFSQCRIFTTVEESSDRIADHNHFTRMQCNLFISIYFSRLIEPNENVNFHRAIDELVCNQIYLTARLFCIYFAHFSLIIECSRSALFRERVIKVERKKRRVLLFLSSPPAHQFTR